VSADGYLIPLLVDMPTWRFSEMEEAHLRSTSHSAACLLPSLHITTRGFQEHLIFCETQMLWAIQVFKSLENGWIPATNSYD